MISNFNMFLVSGNLLSVKETDAMNEESKQRDRKKKHCYDNTFCYDFSDGFLKQECYNRKIVVFKLYVLVIFIALNFFHTAKSTYINGLLLAVTRCVRSHYRSVVAFVRFCNANVSCCAFTGNSCFRCHNISVSETLKRFQTIHRITFS